MATREYPLTLKAVKASQGNQWRIADAVLKEIGGPPFKPGNFEDCSIYLNEQGFDYLPNTLAKYARTASAYPKGKRLSEVSFSAHVDAGTFEVLQQALQQNGGKPPTSRVVRDVRDALRDTAREARERERQALTTRQVARVEAENRRREAETARNDEAAARQEAAHAADVEAQQRAQAREEMAHATFVAAEQARLKAELMANQPQTPTETSPSTERVTQARLLLELRRISDDSVKGAQRYGAVARKSSVHPDVARSDINRVLSAWRSVLVADHRPSVEQGVTRLAS